MAGSIALVLFVLYQMNKTNCIANAANTTAKKFTQQIQEQLSQNTGAANSMTPARESQWDLLGANNSTNSANAYRGSGGMNMSDQTSMTRYLESLSGGRTPVKVGNTTCSVSNSNNCPSNLAYRCNNNLTWSDAAVGEALALSATGALNLPSMEEPQLYDILRFSEDSVTPACANAGMMNVSAPAPAPAAAAKFYQYGGDSYSGGTGDLLKLIR
jgi:hypothetical protein